MIKAIKLVASLLLIFCLSIPLSTCKKQQETTLDGGEDAKRTLVYHRHAIVEQESKIQSYGPAVLFVLPLIFTLMVFLEPERLSSLGFATTEILSNLLLLGYVGIHHFTGTLVLGGYLTIVGALIYIATSFIAIANRKSPPEKEANNKA